MSRFPSRDVWWLILVIGLALNWWLDRKLNWDPIVAEWKAERAQRKSGVKSWDWQALDIPIFARREVADGWYTWKTSAAVEIRVDNRLHHGGAPSVFVANYGRTNIGSINQSFRADQYRGKRLRFTGYVMGLGGRTSAFLWMQVDGPTTATRDAMDDRPITGITKWQQFEIVMDVPDDAVNIAFGAAVPAWSHAWFDDFHFEIVGDDVPVTKEIDKLESHQPPSPPAPKTQLAPVNLDFEAQDRK